MRRVTAIGESNAIRGPTSGLTVGPDGCVAPFGGWRRLHRGRPGIGTQAPLPEPETRTRESGSHSDEYIGVQTRVAVLEAEKHTRTNSSETAPDGLFLPATRAPKTAFKQTFGSGQFSR